MEITEGKAKIGAPEGVFFNTDMRSCRDIGSLWAGTLAKVVLCDAFCASGARGIRYMLENANVERGVFVDMSKNAIAACKKNISKNRLGRKAKAYQMDMRKFLLGAMEKITLLEIDPFGSPAPYLHDAVRYGDKRGVRYLSATATDMAVLCGAHFGACIKNYASRPLDNDFCHENAARILLGRIAREAAAENWGMEVEFTLSHRHYVKVFVKLEQGAPGAEESAKAAMMHTTFCHKCGWRKLSKLPEAKCGNCKNAHVEWAGPMWGGKLFDKNKVALMGEKCAKHPKIYSEEAMKILKLAQEEAEGPEFYYDLHEMAGRHKKRIPGMGDAVEKLRERGFFASRTHFSPTSIRTNAPVKEILRIMK